MEIGVEGGREGRRHGDWGRGRGGRGGGMEIGVEGGGGEEEAWRLG